MSLLRRDLTNNRIKPVQRKMTTSIEGSLSVMPNNNVKIGGIVAQ